MRGGVQIKDFGSVYGSGGPGINNPTLLAAYLSLMQKYGGVYWPIQDTSGTTITSYNTALAVGRNIVINGGFDADSDWSKGTGWSIAAGVASCDGSQVGNSLLTQFDPDLYRLDGNATYRITFDVSNYVAGTLTPFVANAIGIAVAGNGSFSQDIVSGNIGSSGVRANSAFIGDVDNISITQLDIPANSTAFNGTYSGVTLNQPGPAGTRAGLWDGTNDYGDVYSPEINSFFNPNAGTLLAFAKVSGAGVWTDSAYRAVFRFQANANNIISPFKRNANNTLTWSYKAGGTDKSILTGGHSDTGWMFLALTWDSIADQFKGFKNGLQEGSTQTGLGTWAGNTLSTQTLIGAETQTPTTVWDGSIAHVLLLRDVITPAEIRQLAQLGGVYGG